MHRRDLVLSHAQYAELVHARDHDRRAYLRERAAALIKIAQGQSACAVAQRGLLRHRDPDTVYRWLNRYEAEGFAGLIQRSRRPSGCPP